VGASGSICNLIPIDPGAITTTRGLQELIHQALESDHPLRAHGGTWSFSPIAATSGFLLNTRPLNYRFPIAPDQVHPGHPGSNPLFFVQCGTSIADLNGYLATKNLALQTCGASNGQTIAGAVSTGTHGAALNIGAMGNRRRAAVHPPTESVCGTAIPGSATKSRSVRPRRRDARYSTRPWCFGSFGLILASCWNPSRCTSSM
jgi:hypothetical protein